MVIVTDIKHRLKNGELQQGYYMDGYLAENLTPVPKFLASDRDFVGIISGRGEVRTGKSTIASQIGYYIAWLIAGGEMDLRRDEDGRYINPDILKYPKKPVNFTLDNLVFSPEDLMRKAKSLPKNSVIVYDEGRAGLDSKGTMSALNRMLEDFFQECGVYNHVILIVLPNYFKLNEDIATSRSMFLVDVYCDNSFQRGFFNFYNKGSKEWLYFNGKKRVGILAKYLSQDASFNGVFKGFIPFNKKEYEVKKKEALKKKALGTREQQTKQRFTAMVKIYKEDTSKTSEETALRLSEALDRKISPFIIQGALADYEKYMEKVLKRGSVS